MRPLLLPFEKAVRGKSPARGQTCALLSPDRGNRPTSLAEEPLDLRASRFQAERLDQRGRPWRAQGRTTTTSLGKLRHTEPLHLATRRLMGPPGLEPGTNGLLVRCSNQLS